MKIRIKGNSIRLRLTRSEVDALGIDGYIEERTEFANNLFIYALNSNPDVKELTATFVGVKITMHVPPDMVREWATTEKVGYSNTLDTGNGREMFLLLEKDFKCIDAPVHEDQSDNYEHPTMSCD